MLEHHVPRNSAPTSSFLSRMRWTWPGWVATWCSLVNRRHMPLPDGVSRSKTLREAEVTARTNASHVAVRSACEPFEPAEMLSFFYKRRIVQAGSVDCKALPVWALSARSPRACRWIRWAQSGRFDEGRCRQGCRIHRARSFRGISTRYTQKAELSLGDRMGPFQPCQGQRPDRGRTLQPAGQRRPHRRTESGPAWRRRDRRFRRRQLRHSSLSTHFA